MNKYDPKAIHEPRFDFFTLINIRKKPAILYLGRTFCNFTVKEACRFDVQGQAESGFKDLSLICFMEHRLALMESFTLIG
ncbi:hypothetical protein Hanom_Chr04g00334461 [Helianthus anomalus]